MQHGGFSYYVNCNFEGAIIIVDTAMLQTVNNYVNIYVNIDKRGNPKGDVQLPHKMYSTYMYSCF